MYKKNLVIKFFIKKINQLGKKLKRIIMILCDQQVRGVKSLSIFVKKNNITTVSSSIFQAKGWPSRYKGVSMKFYVHSSFRKLRSGKGSILFFSKCCCLNTFVYDSDNNILLIFLPLLTPYLGCFSQTLIQDWGRYNYELLCIKFLIKKCQ